MNPLRHTWRLIPLLAIAVLAVQPATLVRADTTPGAAKTEHKTSFAGNASITAKVKTALLADKITPGMKIDVDTNSGVVTLSGQVDNQTQKDRAAAIAAKTKGVTQVINHLTIKPNIPGKRKAGTVLNDAAITAKVKSGLLADKTAPGMKINVDTVKGIVTLSGEVDTAAQKQSSEAVAKKVKGVQGVINHLTVKTTPKPK